MTTLRDIAKEYGGLIFALLVGGACRFWDLTGSSLFIDEGFVFHISGHTPPQILLMVAKTDFHPPLFYLVTHYAMEWLRWPLWDYRYLTSASSLAGIAATWAIARRFFGPVGAAIAAIALALEPAVIEWDRLYRMYAVLVSLGAVSWWLLLKAGDSRGKAQWLWWPLYGFSAVTLPYVHYVGALVVASQGLYALTRLRLLWPALVIGLCSGLALIPWAWALRIQYPNGGKVIGLGAPGFSWPAEIRSTLAYGIPASWLVHPAFDVAFAIVVLAIVFAALVVTRKTVIPFWLAPIAVQLVASFATGKDLVVPRYLLVFVPAFCIALGACCALLLSTRYRLGAIALLAAYFGVASISIPNLLFVPFYQFPDWYQVNAVLLVNEHPDDIIVLDQGAEYWVVYDFSAFRGHEIEAPAIPSDIPTTIRWIAGYPKRRVWYIENQPAFTDGERHVFKYLESSRHRLRAWRQDRLFNEDVVVIALYGPREPLGKNKVVSTTSP